MRVQYTDELSQSGELDLARVKAGDRVRFLADFKKRAGPNGVVHVKAGELGEVIEVWPESLRVAVSGERTATGDSFSAKYDGEVDPTMISILIDSRDPRVGSERVTAAVAVETWELEAFLHEAVLNGVRPGNVSMVAAELVRVGRRRTASYGGDGGRLRAAGLVLEYGAAWPAFVHMAGFQVDADVDIEDMGILRPAEWAIKAMGVEFQAMHGRAPELVNPKDVAWTLNALASDLETSLPRDVYQHPAGAAELENARMTARQLRQHAARVLAMPPEAWTEAVTWKPAPMAPSISHGKRPSPGLESAPALGPSPLEHEHEQPEPEPEPEPEPVLATEPARPTEGGEVPIQWQSGGGKRWVWAKPGMEVFVKPLSMRGVVQAVLPGDKIVVVNDSGRPQTVDAMGVFLHHRGPPDGLDFVDGETIDAWKSERRQRLRASASREARWAVGSAEFGHTLCYEVTYAADEDRYSGGVGPARVTGAFRGSPGRGSSPGSSDGAVLGARQLWAGVVFHLARAGGLPSLGANLGFGDDPFELGHTFGDRLALAPLGVKELKRWMEGNGTFAVLSAYKERSKSQNQEAHGSMMAELQRAGYTPGQIRVLRGQYFDTPTHEGGEATKKAEQSYLVLGMRFEDAMQLGKSFGQESIIFKGADGVLGVYYTDGSGRMNPALQEGEPAVGSAATQIRPRAPKPERRGPPDASDAWSKARNVSFEFPIDWKTTLTHDGQPMTVEQARNQLRTQREQRPAE